MPGPVSSAGGALTGDGPGLDPPLQDRGGVQHPLWALPTRPLGVLVGVPVLRVGCTGSAWPRCLPTCPCPATQTLGWAPRAPPFFPSEPWRHHLGLFPEETHSDLDGGRRPSSQAFSRAGDFRLRPGKPGLWEIRVLRALGAAPGPERQRGFGPRIRRPGLGFRQSLF